MKQYKYDKFLGIKTGEDKVTLLPPSLHYNPYEPTSYAALEALLKNYNIHADDHFVDFGCGKGRMNFFLHHFTKAAMKGIEMNDCFIEDALINLEHYIRKNPEAKDKIEFIACLAEEYQVTDKDNRFYFFNPFSVHIFSKVINNILHAVEKAPRSVDILIYYPHEEYIYHLEKNTSFELFQEIRIDGYYEQNQHERILIYRY